MQTQKPKNPRKLYHYWLSPESRTVRLTLAERKIDFQLALEPYWERRHSFLMLNPAGDVPVLQEPSGVTISGGRVILEYLEELSDEKSLLGHHPGARAEVRRLCAWFDEKFFREVTMNLLYEKAMKRYFQQGSPSSAAIRAGKVNIRHHLDYIGYLTSRRNWLGGAEFSLADITAAAHLSCLDFLGDVPWNDHKDAKAWYARMKSRPSFRPLLEDQVPGLIQSRDYANLDF